MKWQAPSGYFLVNFVYQCTLPPIAKNCLFSQKTAMRLRSRRKGKSATFVFKDEWHVLSVYPSKQFLKLTLLFRGCPKFLDLEIPVPKSRFDPGSNSYKGLHQCSTFVQIEAYQVSHSFAYLYAKIKKLSRSQYFLKSKWGKQKLETYFSQA